VLRDVKEGRVIGNGAEVYRRIGLHCGEIAASNDWIAGDAGVVCAMDAATAQILPMAMAGVAIINNVSIAVMEEMFLIIGSDDPPNILSTQGK
jgi:dihydropteroate synthase